MSSSARQPGDRTVSLTASTVRPHNVKRNTATTGGLDRVPGAALAAGRPAIPDGYETVDPAQDRLVRVLVGFPPRCPVRHVTDQRGTHQQVVELFEVVGLHLRLAVVDRGKHDFELPAGIQHDLGEDLVCPAGEAGEA